MEIHIFGKKPNTRDIKYVYVSNASIESAKTKQTKKILVSDLWEDTNYRYICVEWWDEQRYINNEKCNYFAWKFISPIEEKKERKLMMTDEEWDEFRSNNDIN